MSEFGEGFNMNAADRSRGRGILHAACVNEVLILI